MKNFLILFFLIIAANQAFSATCTSTTRTNYTTNQVLTSSALNTDFNQLVTKVNAFDGGCVTDGTLEFAAINASEWGAVLKGITQGCKVTKSDTNTISINKCIASVNGSLVQTSSATTATWGCSGCSSEVASTLYYAYIKTGSASTTLNPLISTTAPNADGYDNAGDKVLARFYNNASSNIDGYSIDQWAVNGFRANNTDPESVTISYPAGFGTVGNSVARAWRQGNLLHVNGRFETGTVAASTCFVPLPQLGGENLKIDSSLVSTNIVYGKFSRVIDSSQVYAAGSGAYMNYDGSNLDRLQLSITFSAGGIFNTQNCSGNFGSSEYQEFNFAVPIVGWSAEE